MLAAVVACGSPAPRVTAPVAPAPAPTPRTPALDLASPPVRLGGEPTWSNAGDLVALRYCPGDRELIGLDELGHLRRFRASDGSQIAISTIGVAAQQMAAPVIECRADGTALAIGSGGEPVLVDPHGAITRPPQPIAATIARFADDGSVVALTDDATTIRWDGQNVRTSAAEQRALDTTLLEGGALLEYMFQTGKPATDGVFVTRGATRTKLNGRFGDFVQASIAPDGAVIAADDMASFGWDVIGTRHGFGKLLLDMSGTHLSSVVATNRWFVSVGAAAYVQIVDRAHKTQRELEQPCGEGAHVMAMAVSSDDARLALACDATGIRVLDAATAKPITTDGPRSSGAQLAWSADGTHLATREPYDVRVWNGQTMVARVDDAGDDTTLWWTADGKLGATYGGEVGAWSLHNGTWLAAEPHVAYAMAVHAANGDIVGLVHGTVVTPRRTIALPETKVKWPDAIAVDASAAHVAILLSEYSNQPGTILVVVDIAAGTATTRDVAATAIAIADDGTVLVGGSDGTVHTADGRELARLAGPITAIATSHELVAAAAADSTIAILAGSKPAGTLDTRGDAAAALAFSPDGRRLASTAPDATLIWSIR